jgi:hypothetical protein
MRSLLIVLAGATAGSFIGGGGALWMAYRNDPRRARGLTVAAVVVGGPVVFFPAWNALEGLELDILSPQLILAVVLVAMAIVGRWLATLR